MYILGRQLYTFSSVQSSPNLRRASNVHNGHGVHEEGVPGVHGRKSTSHVQRSASSVSAFR